MGNEIANKTEPANELTQTAKGSDKPPVTDSKRLAEQTHFATLEQQLKRRAKR